MSSAAFNPDERAGQTHEDCPLPGESAPAEPRAELLEEVLQQTMAAISSEEPLEPAEMRALLGVRRRFAGEPLSLEPAATELVGALLKLRFAGLSTSADFWNRMSRWIAETLLDDPPSRARLLALWAQLSETPP